MYLPFNIYLLFVLFILAALGLSCGMWDLVPQPGIEPRPPALGVQSLTHWTTREVPHSAYLKIADLSSDRLGNH